MAMGWGWRPAGPCWSLLCVCAEALSASWGGCPGASPHPQPGFTSPFWRQVEVWSISELGLGCCFLIYCCKRREKKKNSHQETLSKLQGPGGQRGTGWRQTWVQGCRGWDSLGPLKPTCAWLVAPSTGRRPGPRASTLGMVTSLEGDALDMCPELGHLPQSLGPSPGSPLTCLCSPGDF